MRARARHLMAVAAAVALGACSENPAGLATGGGGAGTVTVGQGVAPRYSWPGGGARRLVVSNLGTGEVGWDIQALDQSVGFPSPVSHGVTPGTAREVTQETLLRVGERYRVVVSRVSGGEISAEFIP